LEAAETHDSYWNAAMREMTHTGFMHNYMRMYWAKKIIEWTATPEQAFQRTLALNNKHFLDGRDGNSYANVAWCFGLHDRAWTERPIFGKVRYMAANGLKRKFDMERYVAAVGDLLAAETGSA
jgi:deoxyribodipyrimidine photo-lyase